MSSKHSDGDRMLQSFLRELCFECSAANEKSFQHDGSETWEVDTLICERGADFN